MNYIELNFAINQTFWNLIYVSGERTRDHSWRMVWRKGWHLAPQRLLDIWCESDILWRLHPLWNTINSACQVASCSFNCLTPCIFNYVFFIQERSSTWPIPHFTSSFHYFLSSNLTICILLLGLDYCLVFSSMSTRLSVKQTQVWIDQKHTQVHVGLGRSQKSIH